MLKVSFISYQNYLRRIDSVSTHSEPLTCSVDKRLFVRKIKNYDSALAALKKWLHKWTISLLASCVPNMEFNGLPVNLERLQPEIYSSYCWIRSILTFIVGESQKQRSFTNTAIANQNDFEFRLFNFTAKSLFSSIHLHWNHFVWHQSVAELYYL